MGITQKEVFLRLWNACIGNLFEHYDTALFGFLSPFLAPLIFPHHDPINALILTYAMIPLGIVSRPIGSLVFGWIGDRYGRNQALFFTLAGMAFVSCMIALSPTYSQIGFLSPLIFCVGRVLQNFFAAGETMGGVLLLLENASAKEHDLLSGLYNASTMGGHLLASLFVFVLSQYNWIDPGWRFLYLGGCITVLFGLRARRTHSKHSGLESSDSILSICWLYRKSLIFIVICSGFGATCYSVALVLLNGLIPLISTVTQAEIMKINTCLVVLDFLALPLFGWVASKVSREKLMLAAALSAVVFAIPLFLCLQGASLFGIVVIRMSLVTIGVAFFAPFQAWAGSLIPPSIRYTILSLGYSLGSQLLGSPAAAFSLWCFQKTGSVLSVAWYWMALGIASSISLVMAFRLRQYALEPK